MNEFDIDAVLSGVAKRLAILDFGLFQVEEDGRHIGIPGYLIQTTDGRNILVDTGFPAWYADDHEVATLADGLESFGRVVRLSKENLPAGQLALMGLTPSDIDVLVLTHSDIDHVGGITDYQQVPIVLGIAERAQVKPRYFDFGSPIDWPLGVNYQLVQSDTALCPGVALLESPGHSPGHLSLLIRLEESGIVMLTGDAIARPAEFEVGFGGAWDEVQARRSAERLMNIAETVGAMVIYGHDPAQWPSLRKAPAFYQ